MRLPEQSGLWDGVPADQGRGWDEVRVKGLSNPNRSVVL